jgi:hypothetical protein
MRSRLVRVAIAVASKRGAEPMEEISAAPPGGEK